jgi:hypothetical protein
LGSLCLSHGAYSRSHAALLAAKHSQVHWGEYHPHRHRHRHHRHRLLLLLLLLKALKVEVAAVAEAVHSELMSGSDGILRESSRVASRRVAGSLKQVSCRSTLC